MKTNKEIFSVIERTASRFRIMVLDVVSKLLKPLRPLPFYWEMIPVRIESLIDRRKKDEN